MDNSKNFITAQIGTTVQVSISSGRKFIAEDVIQD